MATAVALRTDFSAADLRRLAAASKNANESRRLLSLAAVRDGVNRTEAARIGGMDRQMLRDWVHRFNTQGPDGLLDIPSQGPSSRLTAAQLAELACWPRSSGPARTGRTRRRALAAGRTEAPDRRALRGRISRTDDRKILDALGFSHISARPRNPAQDAGTIAAFK